MGFFCHPPIRGVVGGLPKLSDCRGSYAVLSMRVLGLCALAQAVHGDAFVALTASGHDPMPHDENDNAHDRDGLSNPEDSRYDSTAFREWPIMDKLRQIAGFMTAECDQGFFGAFQSKPVDILSQHRGTFMFCCIVVFF